jgi:hypothetical protein
MVILEEPPRLIKGRLLLPLRLAAESLGAKVEWDDHARAVYIYYEEPAAKEQEAVTSILKKLFDCLQQVILQKPQPFLNLIRTILTGSGLRVFTHLKKIKKISRGITAVT